MVENSDESYKEYQNKYSSIIEFQRKLFYPVQIPTDSIDHQVQNNIIYSLHELNLKAFESILYLISNKKVSDVFGLSRQIFETTINMGLLAKNLIDDGLAKYTEYDYFQIHKGNNHIMEMGLENFVVLDSKRVVEIKNAVDEISKKRNYKKPPISWTNTNLIKRVQLLDEKYFNYIPALNGHFYEYLYCQLYRASSQILHATPAGFLKMYEFVANSESGKTIYNLKLVNGILEKAASYSLIAFLSSIRFFGVMLNKSEAETYFKEEIMAIFGLI